LFIFHYFHKSSLLQPFTGFYAEHILIWRTAICCCQVLTESSKSPASIAKSNKQWVGTCLYQEECKLLLINCGAVIRCRAA